MHERVLALGDDVTVFPAHYGAVVEVRANEFVARRLGELRTTLPALALSESEFVVPGPGALDGIRKCFADRGGLGEAEIVKFMADVQDREFDRLGIDFRSLWGRRLQLIDCQNLFCEVDKYARVVHPDIAGLSGRTRIKQKFAAKSSPIHYWYPPKWGINDRIAAWTAEHSKPTYACSDLFTSGRF